MMGRLMDEAERDEVAPAHIPIGGREHWWLFFVHSGVVACERDHRLAEVGCWQLIGHR